jgi:glycosyltransferase involved in cell wall biosynthesis
MRKNLAVPTPDEKSIAIWTADYSITTGQAIVTRQVVNNSRLRGMRDYVYGIGTMGIPSWIAAFIRIWADIVLGRFETLYLVCSRSNLGFFRDLPALLAARTGVRTVVHSHGSDIVDLLTSRALSGFARWLYSRCEIILDSSHLLEPVRQAIPASKIHLCENFAGMMLVNDSVATGDRLTVLWNSHIMASKGFFHTIDAIKMLREEGFPIHLIAAGGALADVEMTKEQVTGLLTTLATEEWIDFVGIVQPTEMPNLMARADVVALPSYYESECQPLALIDAMCAGKAIVVADTPSLRATIGSYPATFARPKSVADIASVLKSFWLRKRHNNNALILDHANGARLARERFAIDRFNQRIATILNLGDKSLQTQFALT